MSLHVGVLGTGDWSRVHLAALSDSPHVDTITLVGRNAESREALAGRFPKVARSLADPADLYADSAVDAVCIVLPHDLHASNAQDALLAGKHVICEKPAALSLEQFDSVEHAAESANRRLLVVMNQLYNPVYRRAAERVGEGAVGRPFLSVENSFRNAARNYRRWDYWRNTVARAGGGVLIDGGYHMVYRHLDTLAGCGEPAWVLADTPQLNVRPDGSRVPEKGEDFVSITVGFDRPLRIQWAHGWTFAATPQRARQSFLAGSEGTLELTDDPSRPLILHRDDGTTAIDVPAGPTTGRETTHDCLLDYLAALATEREPHRGSLQLARKTLAIVLAAYRSGRTGQRERLA